MREEARRRQEEGKAHAAKVNIIYDSPANVSVFRLFFANGVSQADFVSHLPVLKK